MPTRLYAIPPQLPTAVLTASFDWTGFLALLPGDTIDTFSVTAEAGVTLGTPSRVGSEIFVRISGGTAGTTYRVTCTVTTGGGESDSMVAVVTVADAA
jgi:hypothetical protein